MRLLASEHDDDVHAHAATALSELARDHPANQTAVADAGGIAPFVALLKGEGAESAKEAAASALWSFSSRHPPNQKAIAEAGGLAPLVALLGMGKPETQTKAAGALAAIALDNPKNQDTIATMLVQLLSSTDVPTRTKAARAISNLARSHTSNQVAIAGCGGIEPLVTMLSSDQKEVHLQKEVASALWSMAFENNENQVAIAAAGGVPLLISLLSKGSAVVHRAAAGALWSLGANKDNQELISKCGGITPLVEMLQPGGHGNAQETAAGALHSLAGLDRNRVAIAEAGGVPAMVALFETGTAEAKTQAAGALSTLVIKNAVNQSTVAQNLVNMLSKENTSHEAQDTVTQLLYNLSLDSENRGALAKWGAIPQLARQLRDGTTSQGQTHAASALGQIALKSAQHRVQVTAQLIKLLGHSDSHVRQRAWTALKDMAESGGSESQMTVQMAGGIDRFVSLLKDGSLEAQEYALWLLWQSSDVTSKVSIATAGCARPIIAILLSGRLSAVAQEHAAAVLSGITSDDIPAVNEETQAGNKRDVVSAGGIAPLVQLLRSGSRGAKRHAALALAQMTRSEKAALSETQFSIAEAGAITALVEWLVDPTLGPPQMAARALADLGRDSADTQATIVEAGAIRPLVKMLRGVHTSPGGGSPAQHDSPTGKADGKLDSKTDAQKWAAGALAALAEGNELNQIAVAEEGGIPPLVEVLRNDAVAPHENATRALWHLSSTPDNQLMIAREGSLPPLVANLSAESDRAKEFAAAALESLSRDCNENQVALARAGAIAPLVLLLGAESAETQLYAQGALLNIAAPNQENRSAVVKPLIALLEVRNAAAQMKSAESLAMLANRSAENRSVIAHAGAIPPLVRLLGDGRNVNKSQVRAAAALSDLARASECKQAIVGAGGVEPLVKMLASHSLEAQTRASGALWHLSSSTSAQQLIADADGIGLLVKLLTCERVAAANHAACALFHLVSSSANKLAIVKAGGIIPLVQLLGRQQGGDRNVEAQDSIAALLADLARQQGPIKNSIVHAGGTAHLVGLLSHGSPGAQKHASCALWGLTSETQFRAAVTEAGAIPPLVALLDVANGNAEARGYAAAALNNLANDPDCRTPISDAGAVDLLLTISHGPQNWLRSQAVGILQLLRVEAPPPERVTAIKVPVVKSYFQTVETEKAEEERRVERGEPPTRRRAWDSCHGNPKFVNDTTRELKPEYATLLFSPRFKSKASYKFAIHDPKTFRPPAENANTAAPTELMGSNGYNSPTRQPRGSRSPGREGSPRRGGTSASPERPGSAGYRPSGSRSWSTARQAQSSRKKDADAKSDAASSAATAAAIDAAGPAAQDTAISNRSKEATSAPDAAEASLLSDRTGKAKKKKSVLKSPSATPTGNESDRSTGSKKGKEGKEARASTRGKSGGKAAKEKEVTMASIPE